MDTKVKAGFDPMSDLFVAQFSKPAHFHEVNLRALSAFQRALLVIDGTVTKFIEAYTMEPVDIVRLGQSKQELQADHDWLEVSKHTPIIARHVMLQGKYSSTLYAYAISLIVPGRVPANIKDALGKDGEGLGRILLAGQIETRREVLWYGRERVQDLPETVGRLSSGDFFSRTYRIIACGKPIMLINEKFPVNVDRQPSHE